MKRECEKISETESISRKLEVAHAVVLALSVALIVLISYFTFHNMAFWESEFYLTVQAVVCLLLMADFFFEMALLPTNKRLGYLKTHWLWLVLSIPYLNIIDMWQLSVPHDALCFIRLVPLARGGLAMVIIINYISSSRLAGMFVSYLAVLVLTVYFAALIFYEREHSVNPGIPNFWYAFLWCAQETTTCGSSIAPVTVAGKIVSVVVAFMGLLMYPLFTVYLSGLLLKRVGLLNFANIMGVSVKTASSAEQKPLSTRDKVVKTDKKA